MLSRGQYNIPPPQPIERIIHIKKKYLHQQVPTALHLQVVESNQSYVICFDLIRFHQTHLLVRRQEVRGNSNLVANLIDSHQLSQRPCGAIEDFRSQ